MTHVLQTGGTIKHFHFGFSTKKNENLASLNFLLMFANLKQKYLFKIVNIDENLRFNFVFSLLERRAGGGSMKPIMTKPSSIQLYISI